MTRLLSPAEVRERKRNTEAAAVAPLVADWRRRIANAMLAGEACCDTDTRTDLHSRSVLEAAHEELQRELRAVGWASLEWRPKRLDHEYGNQGLGQWSGLNSNRGAATTVQLIWSEVAK